MRPKPPRVSNIIFYAVRVKGTWDNGAAEPTKWVLSIWRGAFWVWHVLAYAHGESTVFVVVVVWVGESLAEKTNAVSGKVEENEACFCTALDISNSVWPVEESFARHPRRWHCSLWHRASWIAIEGGKRAQCKRTGQSCPWSALLPWSSPRHLKVTCLCSNQAKPVARTSWISLAQH